MAEISTQALLLHAAGIATSIHRGTEGRISGEDARRLADESGALISELVDEGVWQHKADDSYVIRAGRLTSPKLVDDVEAALRESEDSTPERESAD